MLGESDLASNRDPIEESRLKAIGQAIRDSRENRGLTQRALGERIGKSLDAISRIERGEARLDVSTFFDIARELNQPAFLLLLRIQFSIPPSGLSEPAGSTERLGRILLDLAHALGEREIAR